MTTSKKEKGLKYKKMLELSLRGVRVFGRPASSHIPCYMYREWKGIKTPYINTLSVREMSRRAGIIVARLAECQATWEPDGRTLPNGELL